LLDEKRLQLEEDITQAKEGINQVKVFRATGKFNLPQVPTALASSSMPSSVTI
jgi:hypothetical protein